MKNMARILREIVTDPVPTRVFETGAKRDTDAGKLDYEGFYEPLTFDSFAKYLHKHRTMQDGSLRDSDNWQKGIPRIVYMKSAFRHFVHAWKIHRGYKAFDEKGNQVSMEDSINGAIFNLRGYLYEWLKHTGLSTEKEVTQGLTSLRAAVDRGEVGALPLSHNDTPAEPGAREATSWGSSDSEQFL
jgi:hypothetical protein